MRLLCNSNSFLSPLTILTSYLIISKSHAWVPLKIHPTICNRIKPFLQNTKVPSIPDDDDIPELFKLPKDDTIWKSKGEEIIMKAVLENGCKAEDASIQWKPGQIIVTISGDSILKADDDTDNDNILDIDEDENYEKALQEFENEFDDEILEEDNIEIRTDVVSIARAINIALGEEGEDSIGYRIAVHHSIEVTTPGASDELHGIMFQSYKGFDVIAETIDPKDDQKVKVVEGKLVERNEEQTVLNVKGRLRKLKNELVIRVKLPKAKKESKMK